VVKKLKAAGIVTSAFIEPLEEQIVASAECGFNAVELWTGQYANAKTERTREKALEALIRALECGFDRGLTVHAGHGLTYRNIGPVAALGAFEEFNIGHSVVARAIFVGMRAAVREMKELLHRATSHLAVIASEQMQP
jgi:pyridoxine 5-phosphate synthase